jgi:hypothetical protein
MVGCCELARKWRGRRVPSMRDLTSAEAQPQLSATLQVRDFVDSLSTGANMDSVRRNGTKFVER